MITRSKMRRQLYRGGGITELYPRKKYGLGDFVRKLIPNELADVAVKAAPFVAPFNPLAAGLMRGIGRYDQRGSLSDALKQGVATYGIGQLGQRIGTGSFQPLQNPFTREAFRSPIGAWSGTEGGFRQKAKDLAFGKEGKITSYDLSKVDPSLAKHVSPIKVGKDTTGFLGAGGKFNLKEAFGKGVPAIFAGSTLAALATQKALGDVGGREPGESLTAFNKRRESTVANYLAYYYKRANKFRIPPEKLEEKTAEFVKKNTTEYRTGENQGGRIGLRHGTPEMGIKSLDAGAPDITYEGNEGPQAPQEEQKMADALLREEYDKYVYDLLEIRPEATPMSFEEFRQMVIAEGKMSGGQPLPEDPTKPINPFAPKPTGPVLPDKMMAAKGGRIGYDDGGIMMAGFGTDKEVIWEMARDSLSKEMFNKNYEDLTPDEMETIEIHLEMELGKKETPQDIQMAAKGGRIGQMIGTGPAGLPGIPRQAPDGMEFDMRENGGFQGLGAKEKKDDVPAMLAKNEFVFTADAVRGAGGGDIELGAQRMYDTMKNLEKRVV